MDLTKLSNQDINDLLAKGRDELQNRANNLCELISNFDLGKYKSVYSRLQSYYTFCHKAYNVTEGQIKGDTRENKVMMIRNALMNYLALNGFSWLDVAEEFDYASRNCMNAKKDFHNKHYSSNKVYTDLYDDIVKFFKD